MCVFFQGLFRIAGGAMKLKKLKVRLILNYICFTLFKNFSYNLQLIPYKSAFILFHIRQCLIDQ